MCEAYSEKDCRRPSSVKMFFVSVTDSLSGVHAAAVDKPAAVQQTALRLGTATSSLHCGPFVGAVMWDRRMLRVWRTVRMHWLAKTFELPWRTLPTRRLGAKSRSSQQLRKKRCVFSSGTGETGVCMKLQLGNLKLRCRLLATTPTILNSNPGNS